MSCLSTVEIKLLLSPVATDGKDGHGLKLENVGHFFQDLQLCLQIKNQKYYGLCSLVKYVGYLLHKSRVEFFVFPAFSRKLTARWESQGSFNLFFH